MEMTHNFYRLTPKEFHKYPSCVVNVISYSEYGDGHVEKFELIEMFKKAGIKAYDDNKIVFECEYGSSRLYIGFYDGEMSIGLGVMHED